MATGYLYIMALKRNGTLYVGVTSDLANRVDQHMQGRGSQFTAKYGCKRLVWYEKHHSIDRAITREKTIKKWPRQWKIDTIETDNPNWNDLRYTLV